VALRALPVLKTVLDPGRLDVATAGRSIILPTFRAVNAAWVAAIDPTRAAVRAAKAAADAPFSSAPSKAATAAANAAAFAAAVPASVDVSRVLTAVKIAASTVVTVTEAAAHAVSSGASTPADLIYGSISDDARALGTSSSIVSSIARRPLWKDRPPDGLNQAWQKFECALLGADENWEVWTTWYRARLDGLPTSDEFEIARVTIAEEIWSQGPQVANAHIKKLIAQ
jgi:hypothetical protein